MINLEESVFSGAKENGGYHMNSMKLSFSLSQPAARGRCSGQLEMANLKYRRLYLQCRAFLG